MTGKAVSQIPHKQQRLLVLVVKQVGSIPHVVLIVNWSSLTQIEDKGLKFTLDIKHIMNYNKLFNLAAQACARYDAAEARAKAAEAEAKMAALEKEALKEVMLANLKANFTQVDSRTWLYYLLVMPVRVAKKGIHGFNVLRHYMSESLKHEGASRRDIQLLTTRSSVLFMRQLTEAEWASHKAHKSSTREEIMSILPIEELLKQPKK